MSTRQICVAAIISLLSLCAHAAAECNNGGVTIKTATSGGFITGCTWAVPLLSMDANVCTTSGGFLLAIRDIDTQKLFMFFGISSGFQLDVWVGATVTDNGTTVDTSEQALSYTNFAEGYPSKHDMRSCVVLNKDWDFKWKNIKPNPIWTVYALCTDVAVYTDPDVGLTTDTGIRKPDLDTRVAGPGTRGSGLNTTGVNSGTTEHDLPISTSLPSVTFPIVASSASTHTSANTATTVTGQWSSAPTTSTMTPSPDDVSEVYDFPSTESTDGPLPVTRCHNSTNYGTNSCCCVCAPHQNNTTNIDDILDELRQILTVDKASLSSTYRRKHSVEDNRDTSVCMGCVAIAVLVIILIIVIFLDLSHFLFRGCPVKTC